MITPLLEFTSFMCVVTEKVVEEVGSRQLRMRITLSKLLFLLLLATPEVAFAQEILTFRGDAIDPLVNLYVHSKQTGGNVSIGSTPERLYIAVVNGSSLENSTTNEVIRRLSKAAVVDVKIDVANQRPFLRVFFLPDVFKDGEVNLRLMKELQVSPMLLDLVQKSAAKAFASGPAGFRDKCVPVTVYLNGIYPYQSVVFINSGLDKSAIESCVIEGAASVLGLDLDTLNALGKTNDEKLTISEKALWAKRTCVASSDMTTKCLVEHNAN